MRLPRLPLIAIAAAASALAAGCTAGTSSSSGPDLNTLISSMKTAMYQAQSVHVKGTATDQGRTMALDMTLLRTGGEAGTVSSSDGAVDLLILGGKAYLKINPDFLKQAKLPASDCAHLCGKYVLTSAAASGLASSFSMKSMLDQSLSQINAGNAGSITGKATVNGQLAWVVTGDGAKGYIAATGKPYLLRISLDGQGNLDFTQWNTATLPPPPPASQTLDPTKLGG